MNKSARLRVLFFQLEFPNWTPARPWSYCSHLAYEEGFRANEVEYFTIPLVRWNSEKEAASWLNRVRDICIGKRFDQVWIELIHSKIDETFLEWLTTIAPVRVGFLPESLGYHHEEYAEIPEFKNMRIEFEKRIKYMTHLLSVDEKDAEEVTARKLVTAMWWPQAMPERLVFEQTTRFPAKYAIFCGTLYSKRLAFLEKADMKESLVFMSVPKSTISYLLSFISRQKEKIVSMPPPEGVIVCRVLFDFLQIFGGTLIKKGLPGYKLFFPLYHSFLGHVRKRCFIKYLKGLQIGSAIVNLPSFVKAYSGRVIEGMAAGRPVISWEIPDRPRNKTLFEDGKEILLYPGDDPSLLARHIQRILSEPEFGQQIAANARRKIKRFHTIEKRTSQILNWIENGSEPIYN